MAGISIITLPFRPIRQLAGSSHYRNVLQKHLSVMENKSKRFSSLSQLQKNSEKDEWFVSAAVCVERIPSITPSLSNFEQTVLEHLNKNELEAAKKSNFELRHESDIEAAEARRLEGLKLLAGTKTAEDDHDLWVKDLEPFVAKSKTTHADTINDVTSTVRQLDNPLHLIVERNIGAENNPGESPEFCWDLPNSIRREGETIRQTAERALKEICGSQLDVHILGNAPWAYYNTKYTKKIRNLTGKRGEKTFIFKAHYKDGKVQCPENISRAYRWSTLSELDILEPHVKNTLMEILYINDIDSS